MGRLRAILSAVVMLGVLTACQSQPAEAPGCQIGARCESESAVLRDTRLEEPGPGKWEGYSGTNFVVGFEHPGTSIAWTVSGVPAAPRRHVLAIRYSNYRGQDGQERPRSLTLVVNSRPRRVTMPPTHSWSSWSNVVVPDVALQPGANDLRLECTSADTGRVNIDFIEIY